jgi:oligoendopeptidase F
MHDPLEQLEAAFEAANIRVGEATWNIYSGEAAADLDDAQRELAGLLTSSSSRALVDRSLGDEAAHREPLMARRLEIWRNCFAAAAVENLPEIYTLKNRLQQRIATFEFELDGSVVRRSELQKILRNHTNRELRHRAWGATSTLAGANRAALLRLIELRNHHARQLGYRDYFDLVLKVQEVDETWLRRTLDHLAAAAQPHYHNLIESLRRKAGVPQLAPWDVAFAMRQGFQLPDSYFPADKALDRLRITAQNLGFAVDRLPIRTLIRDIPFGGYNVAVRIPDDTRFLVNPSEGHGFYTTTFHEYGHSLQAVSTRTTWPILKEYEWATGGHNPAYSEGMAEVMGEFARRPDWLKAVARMPDAEVERYKNQLLPAQMVLRFFDLLLNMRIEWAAYAGEAQDMGAVERELTREVRGLDFPPDDPPQWEANTWYTTYPVYWHNYILASVIATQVHDTITARFGPEASLHPEVADYLREHFYASGNSVTWTERIIRGTGTPLGTDAYLRRLHPSDPVSRP